VADCTLGEAFEGGKHLRLMAEWTLILGWVNREPATRAGAVYALAIRRSSDVTGHMVGGLDRRRPDLDRETWKEIKATRRAAKALAKEERAATDDELWETVRKLPSKEMAAEAGLEELWELCWGPLHRSSHFWGYDGADPGSGDDLVPSWRAAPTMLLLATGTMAQALTEITRATRANSDVKILQAFKRLEALDAARPRIGRRTDEDFGQLLDGYLERNDPERKRKRERERRRALRRGEGA